MSNPDKLIIEENENFVRDVRSNAILNTDLTALQKYKMKRAKEQEVLKTIDEVKELKGELSEIKSLLHQLLAEKK